MEDHHSPSFPGLADKNSPPAPNTLPTLKKGAFHLQDAARARLDHTQFLVLARGGEQAAASVLKDMQRITSEWQFIIFTGSPTSQVPDEDLGGQTCRRQAQPCWERRPAGVALLGWGPCQRRLCSVTQIHHCPWADPSPSRGSSSYFWARRMSVPCWVPSILRAYLG